jgi:hypothetical protein
MSRTEAVEPTWGMGQEEAALTVASSCKGVAKWGGLSLFASALALVIYVVGVVSLRQTLPIPRRPRRHPDRDPLHRPCPDGWMAATCKGHGPRDAGGRGGT